LGLDNQALVKVTAGRKLKNGLVIPGSNFQGNNKKPAIGRKVSRGTYEREALMHTHGYFPREKGEENRCDFKGLLCHTH